MKRIMMGALLLAGAGLVSACGGSDEPATTEAPTPPAESAPEADTPPAPEEETAETGPSEAVVEEAAAETESEFAGLPEPYASADFNRGKRTFRQCQACHTIEEGGPNVLGPNLYGLFGREAGAKEDFAYSKALQDADFTWTPDKLEQWLANPRSFLPGNAMSFAGVRRPDDRHAVIAYLMINTGYGPESE